MYQPQNTPRIGIYEKALPNQLLWQDKLQVTKDLGFDFIEISIDESDERRARLDWSDDEIYSLRHQCEKIGIPLHSMCLSAHRKYPFGSANNDIRSEAQIIMDKAITLAYKLGIRVIQLAGYDVYYEPADLQTHQRFIQGMQWAVKQAERAGVMLAVEIMDTPYLNSLSKFEILKKNIDSPYFMAYPDVGNITGWNYDTCTELMLSRDHIVQIHLKDTFKVKADYSGQFRDLVIGEGEVDFAAIFATLRTMNYVAPLVIEMWAKDDKWQENIMIAQKRLKTIGQKAKFPIFSKLYN
ncbi:L-ribulose-5-phosphate 3-epimerase [Gilliamella sp. Choc4-2]|uniref:L-ribulose-5-phosphate 3-epimerase n=1 Tax=Gilliamella sp. Choc4-2 TaxID=3120237 RepID=UPI003FA5D51B